MSQSAHQQVTSLIEDMKSAANNPRRMDEISNEISVLTRAYMEPSIAPEWERFKFTPTQRRIIVLLNARLGTVVERSNILDALYFDKPNGEADSPIINVLICLIRKKLIGSGYTITNSHGIGYRLNLLGIGDEA